ncbi:MAG: cyclic nucleotide-binding domain-containing protein [Acidimicrobiales bacterium]|nr:cyclic nucleotide-binding domain-containing protein [Acidimicrobiales bacterium]
MRIESSITTVSWIPSEAVTGPVNKGLFESGLAHYDDPLPDVLGDLDVWRKEDRYRFANHLGAAIEVDEDGSITNAEYTGGLHLNSTTVRVGRRAAVFQPIALPTIQAAPVVADGTATFVQTVGGRTGVPAPRRVNHPPFVQLRAPVVWTTLKLVLRADGTAAHELVGASDFPRHWLYDADGALSAKVGLADFTEWYRHAFGKHTPWGDQESPQLVTAVETALERELAARIMRGGEAPEVRTVDEGHALTEQGAPGDEVFLVLDGVVDVEVDGEVLAEMGPGAVLGERAVLEGGVRTSTVRARTRCRVAVARSEQIDRAALAELSEGHRREEG